MNLSDCDREIIVLTRAPIAGRTKTRLMPDLSAGQCGRLHAAFLHDLGKTVHRAALACGARVVVLADPFDPAPSEREACLPDDAAFAAGSESGPDAVVAANAVVREAFGDSAAYGSQRGGGLGDRMAIAFSDAFGRGADRCVLIGSDSPELPATAFAEAFAALSSADCVFAPSFDGGYCLVGMSAPHPEAFDIDGYGGPTVLDRTLARARALGLSCAALSPVADVDDITDLRSLAARLCERGRNLAGSDGDPSFPSCTYGELGRLASEGVMLDGLGDGANGFLLLDDSKESSDERRSRASSAVAGFDGAGA